jgi:tetratricopeptide (TPR) repeat protein
VIRDPGGKARDGIAFEPTREDNESSPSPSTDWQAEAGWKPGALVGERYELLEQVGSGAFGVVFRARDRIADEIVALKILSRAPASEEVATRLRREVQIARRIAHPGVVRTHDLVQIGNSLVASMEYVEGETLARRLADGRRLTAKEITDLATDLARGLAAAHRVGVIHRDLKPANIILRSETGRAVIGDFGIARVQPVAETPSRESAPTLDGVLIGTPEYMAPEQLLGERAGPGADVYAFALVMYEAATGKRLSSGRTPAQLAVERGRPPELRLASERPDLPIAIVETLRRCLEPDPEQRLRDGAAVRSALAEVSPVTAAFPLQSRRPRWLLPGGLIAIAIVVAALVFVLSRSTARVDGMRSFAVEVENRGASDDAWIQKPLDRMMAKRLRHTFLGVRRAGDPKHADAQVRVGYRRTTDGIELELAMTGVEPTTVTDTSVAGALDKAIAKISAKVHHRPIEPDADERADMQRLGVRSVEAYRRYQSQVDDAFSAVLIDAEAQVRQLRAILVLEPQWAHLYVKLVDAAGIGSPQGREVLAEAKRATQHTDQDPVGRQMLAAIEHVSQGRLDDAATLLVPAFRSQPQDVELGWILARRVLFQAGRSQDAIAVYQRLHEQRPDLQFGGNLVDELRRGGRGREIGPVVEAWLAKAPESEDARAVQVKLDVEYGRLDLAVQHAREQIFLHGEAPHRLYTLCDVLIAAGKNAEASQLAYRMLLGSGSIRSRGWARLGAIAAQEGRFAAAIDAYESAVAEGKQFPAQSGVRRAYESARWLFVLTGQPESADRFDRELAEYYRNSGLTWVAESVEFDRRLLGVAHNGCPDPETLLATLPQGPALRLARIQMRRAAAAAGCVPCADVVRDGISVDEASQHGLYQLGMCAAKEGALALARDAFVRAAALRTAIDTGFQPSEAHAILARFQLARVLERMQLPVEARKEYETFLVYWGQADRPIPEVDEARTALARLR